VVGLVGGETFGPAARMALRDADVLVGSSRQLAGVSSSADVERIELSGPLADVLETIAARAGESRRVCVLASGDPGFFGIVRSLAARVGPSRLSVHPAPSSVSLAFARLGLSWDDASVVSAHGRSLAEAAALAGQGKVAVLTSPDNSPEKIGRQLVELGCGRRTVTVLSHIGEGREKVTHTDLPGLASGRFDPMSVVVLTVPDPGGGSDCPTLRWGLPEDQFDHRNRMITKSEVRAVALGRLALPPTGVLWDVGAGSGSVAIECARLQPGLRVIAIERSTPDAERVRANADTHHVAVEVVEGEAPAALAPLPDPDRVFIGGGGLSVLDVALSRLRPAGAIVATYALVDRAALAWKKLGNMVQLSVSRAVPVGAESVRLSAENPVFLCWGPEP
jgi:precorrin-6B C5,15-methyltransferase / cobalt-precorrin-6B C5,C15-methyltransferase